MSEQFPLPGGIDVSRETRQRLAAYAALLRKWNPAINLVSRATLPELESRHIADSVQLFPHAPAAARSWADLGSGGGLPGLVVAILAREHRPELEVTLVESDRRKAAFLATAVREFGLKARICVERIENTQPLGADIVSARALAPLPKLLEFAYRHLAPGGVALFPKGASHEAEIAESLERWRFSVQKLPSLTEPGSVVLRIGDIARA